MYVYIHLYVYVYICVYLDAHICAYIFIFQLFGKNNFPFPSSVINIINKYFSACKLVTLKSFRAVADDHQQMSISCQYTEI